MTELEQLKEMMAAMQAKLDALSTTAQQVVYPNDTVTPRPNPSLVHPDQSIDPLEWAKRNPEAGRQATVAMSERMMGGPAQPTPERDANLARWQAEFNAERFTGPINAASLAEQDPHACVYLRWAVSVYGPWLYYRVLNGGHVDINRVRNVGFDHEPHLDPHAYRGSVRDVVHSLLR